MPTRPRMFRPRDVNERAFQIVQELTGQAPPTPTDTRNPADVMLGALAASSGSSRPAGASSRLPGDFFFSPPGATLHPAWARRISGRSRGWRGPPPEPPPPHQRG